jgi:phage terminase small subunit
MQAKPGRPKAGLAVAKVDYRPPTPPVKLDKYQQREWDEITSSPLLTNADESLLFSYARKMALRDQAFANIQEHGLTVVGAKGDDKTNVCWKVFRDCEQDILEIKKLLMHTPRARAELRSAGLLAPATPEDDIETD